MNKILTFLVFLVFFILPFQKPIFQKALKKVGSLIIPSGLDFPVYFSTKIKIFPSEFFILILFCILLYLMRGSWWSLFFSGPSKYLSFFVLAVLFSIGCSSTSHYLLMYIRVFKFALAVSLFHCMKMAFNKESAVRFIKGLAYVIVGISLFESSVALLQYALQKRLGLSFMGEVHFNYCKFEMPGGCRWIFDTLFNIQRECHWLRRASGTFPHPNIFGGFHFCAMLFTFYLFFTTSVKKYKTLLQWVIALQTIVLLLIFSRAAIIALLLSSSIWFILYAREKRQEIKRLAFTFIASGTLGVCLFYPQLAQRGGIVNYNKGVKGADSERIFYQKMAWEMIKERPLLGVGLNNFQIHSQNFFSDEKVYFSKTHNIYLLIAAETGLFGISCFLLFLFSILRHVRCFIQSQEGVFL